MSLPVSVIVAHQKKRRSFFQRFCLPSIKANDPAEILIEDGDGTKGTGNPARNRGAAKATQEFLAFVDDDTVLASDFLLRLTTALRANPSAGYAYSDFLDIVLPGCPTTPRWSAPPSRAGAFDPSRLCRGNYISTMSVIRRELFPGFDLKIKRFQDWDLWLTLLDRGIMGTYVAEHLVWNCHIDKGITISQPKEPNLLVIWKKHEALMRRYP